MNNRPHIQIHINTIILFYLAIILTIVMCSEAKAERVITDDLVANTLKAEYPSDEWKVVPRDEVCVPPRPCGKKTEETTGTLHEKLKYDCPPCRKCVKEIAEIGRLKNDITEYRAEINRLKTQIEDLDNKLAEEQNKPPQIKVEEKRVDVPDDKKNYLYFSPMYAQDGIIATDKEGDTVYEASTVQSLMVGAGYTRFFEFSKAMDIGLGLGGFIGQTGYGINGQMGVKF